MITILIQDTLAWEWGYNIQCVNDHSTNILLVLNPCIHMENQNKFTLLLEALVIRAETVVYLASLVAAVLTVLNSFSVLA